MTYLNNDGIEKFISIREMGDSQTLLIVEIASKKPAACQRISAESVKCIKQTSYPFNRRTTCIAAVTEHVVGHHAAQTNLRISN